MARAIVEEYWNIPDGNHPDESVYLPKKLKLDWSAGDRLHLGANFAQASTKVNEEFPADKYAALLRRRSKAGLSSASTWPQVSSRSQRQDRRCFAKPSRHHRRGVELGTLEPAPLGVDGAMRTELDPVALSSTRTSLRDELIGPALPTAPGPSFDAKPQASSRLACFRTRASSGASGPCP